MKYKALHITFNKPGEADLLTGLLERFHFDGFEEQENLLIAYCSRAGFPEKNKLNEALKGFSYQIREIQDQNWNSLWESHFRPIVIDEFCGIRADFHPSIEEVVYEIIINPRMAFGTGHHATTKMMIQLMQEMEFRNKKVLDFGCGTGILSILSEKMGAKKITAIDNDSNAIENANENLEKNNNSKIELLCNDHPEGEEKSYDIILANINRNTILSHSKALASLNGKGDILLSGFLKKDKQAILEKFVPHGYILTKTLSEGAWVALHLKVV